jgi:HlyD family secretion protein
MLGCSTQTKDNNSRFTATVEAESFYIPTEIAGKITSISVEQGNEVKSNQIIAELETSTLELQKQQAEAALKIAELKRDDLPKGASSKVKSQAKEAVKQAQASVDLIKLQLEKTKVISAVEGVISEVFLHKGEVVSPGMNIAKAINLNSRYIKIYVEEEKRNRVKLGSGLPIYYNDENIGAGKIIFISPESEFTPKNVEKKGDKEKTVFEVKVKLEDNFSLMPGTMVEVEIKE